MITTVIIAIVCFAVGGGLSYMLFRYGLKSKYDIIIKEAQTEAEVIKKNKLLEVKEKFLNKKADLEKEVALRNQKIQQAENKLKQRELMLNQKQEEVQRKRTEAEAIKENLEAQIVIIDKKKDELDKLQMQEREKLEALSGLSAEEAKERLIESLKEEAKTQAASYINDIMDDAKLTANKEAKRIVIHSATKFIGGHGTTLGGVIVDSGKFDWVGAADKFPWLVEPNVSYHGVSFAKDTAPAAFVTYIRAILLRDTGATISPVHSFIFLQGLETLSLRVERHVENALKVVQYLKNQPLVEKVNHPSISTNEEQQALYKKYFPNGGGSIFTFEIKGGAAEAQKFIDNLELFSLLANVADVKSLAIHPASTTHSECNEAELLDQGIKPNTIRLSIGTENIDDIIEDLDEAFKALQ